MKTFLLLTRYAITFLASAGSVLAASVKFEAESGTRGADYAIGNDGAIQYIYPTSNAAGESPGNSARVVTYSVTFPAAGTYDLYARVRVGPAGADDDSFFYGNGFGTKSPTSSGDWIRVNSLDVGGYTAASDVVAGSGSAGITVWKWVNLSEFSNGSSEAGITFTVTADNQANTFQIGAREDGLWIDALVFGTSTSTFTVADLDGNTNGGPTLTTNGSCTVGWTDIRQRIDGFGGGVQFLSPSSLDPVTNSVMDTLFLRTNANQLGLSLLRIGIDPVNWNNNQLLDAQKAVARGASILASPWTPPADMKDNNDRVGGSLLPEQYTNYAVYLNDFAGFMASNGAPLKVISIQNEPDWNASYDSCVWTATQLQTFCHNVAGLITNAPVMMPESLNYNHSMSDPTLNDPVAAANVDIIGGHLYGNGDAGAAIVDYPNAHNKGKPTWMTEFLVNDQTIGTAITTAKQIHDCLTIGNMSAYIWWKAYGDANGLVNASGVPQKRGFVLGQWSWFVRPNDYRIGVTNVGPGFVSAYKNTNSSQFAIVAINTNASTVITQTFNLAYFNATSVTPWITSATNSLAVQPAIAVSNDSFIFTMPPQSVVTFVGQAVTNEPNTAPALAFVADRAVHAGVTLMITNAATDAEVPPQTLTFSLLSTTPTNATLNTTNGILTWRPLVSQADTSNVITVRVADNGSPSLSDTNSYTITVNPLTQPTLDSISATGGQVNLTVSGPRGPDYTLWTSTNLFDWRVLFTTNSPVPPVTLTDTNAAVDFMRFYRMQLGP